MNDQEIFAPFIGRGEPSSLFAVNACGMSLIHDQEPIVPIRDRDELFQRREIAIHAEETFDHDLGAARSAFGAPVAVNRVVDRLGVVMGA